MTIGCRDKAPSYAVAEERDGGGMPADGHRQRVTGVGTANVFGSKDYSMRIWLKPDAMAQYGLVPDDVTNVINDQNIEAAPGKFGENSNQSFQYIIRYNDWFFFLNGNILESVQSDEFQIVLFPDSSGDTACIHFSCFPNL